MRTPTRILTTGISFLIIIAAALYGGIQIGKSTIATRGQMEEPEKLSTEGPFGTSSALIAEALRLIENKYVHIEDVNRNDFLYGALEGVVGALDDPYSSFFRPEDAKKFDEDIRGNFGGIGAEIGKRDGSLVIVAPLEGNPAEKAGLKAGDRIVKVDDTFTADLSVEEAVKIIRGEVGTEVLLLVMREGWEGTKEFPVVRANIMIPTLKWEMLQAHGESEPNVTYIELYSFNANASRAFSDAVFQALFRGTKGMIVDLRNNSGGYLDVAIDIAGHFLPRGEVVTMERFRSGETRALVSRGNAALRNLPVVILVNGGSASASEILAGALRDHMGAILIGETTFGKGSVQELETLQDGSTLKISTAEWITPNGHSIDKVGLAPDLEVELEEAQEGEEQKDAQKEAALQVIGPRLGAKADSPIQVEIIDLQEEGIKGGGIRIE